MVDSANADVPESKNIDEMIAKGRERGPVGFSGGPDPWHKKRGMIDDWDFIDKSHFVYILFLSKLNIELQGKTIGISEICCFALYIQVVKAVD